MQQSESPIVFELDRLLDAPRERVWAAWSQADALARWWGPQGCTVTSHRFEFRPGGFFHYAMTFAGLPSMWGRFMYREIVEGERIAWLNSFANEHGGIARAPFNDACPMEIENTVTFTEEDGKTRLSLRATPFGATPVELSFFDALRPSLEQGFGGTFEQLAAYLKRV
ncbi:SRPBCC domain-containing protein [Caballeronia sp. BR00000012568055]|uniref:SRPBCC family protein n=1 Tax=Caballeronia sp. BR00000012568055 TaxID=2918761 RepID=UPI0023F694EA|nr:SRPBCC domain-containing protein [Caballeronia sp. BR00000012568055]